MVDKLDKSRAEQPEKLRTLRRSLPLIVIGIVLLSLYLLPQLPPVRAWLLTFATGAAQRSGYTVSYEQDRGNPWTGLRLEEAKVSGPGVDISVERLGVDYFLPALLAGRLPLSVEAEGVRGELTLGDIARPQGSGGGLPIRLVLRDVRLDDIMVQANDIPFTVPDLSFSDVRVRSTGDETLSAQAHLSTPEGEADVDAVIRLSPLSVVAEIPQADVTIARRWWKGIEDGTLSGTVRFEEGEVRAEAEVQNGALSFLGESLSNISGTVDYTHPRVNATLTGDTLGGQVAATGGVAIDERRWFAEATGEVGLRDTALWLAKGRLPVSIDAVPLSGDADVQVQASGWRDVNVTGTGNGAGTVATYPLEDLAVDFGFSSEDGANADITAVLAGGALRSSLTPTPEGFDFTLNAENVALLDALTGDLAVDLVQDGTLSGTTRLDLGGQLLGEPVDVAVDGGLSPEGLRLPVTGEVLSGSVAGDIVLVGGVLDAQVNLRDAALPRLSESVDLDLRANGPTTSLPLSLSLASPEQTRLILGPVSVEDTLDGTLTAVLNGVRLDQLSGQLGPLSLQGDVALNARDGNLTYALGETELSGLVEGTLSLADGQLTLRDRQLGGSAALSSSALALPGATLPPLDAGLSYTYDQALTVELLDPGAGISARLNTGLGAETAVATGELELTLENTPVTLAGQSLTLSGSAEADPSALLDSLVFDLQGQSELGRVTLTGDADEARFELAEPGGVAGGAVGPGALGSSLEAAINSLNGSVRLRERTAQLTGQLGDLGVSANASVGAALRAEATLSSGPDALRLNVSGSAAEPLLELSGALPAAPLGDLVGTDLEGRIRADLQRGAGGYSGSVDFAGEAAAVPLDLSLEGAGARLELSGEATLLGIPVNLSGTVQPDLQVNAQSDYGEVRFADGRLVGSGTLPGVSTAGLLVEPQPWRLNGSLAEQNLDVTLPDADSQARLSWGEAGWRLRGDLSPTVPFREGALSLVAEFSASADNPRGNLSGTLGLTTPETSGSLALAGSLDALQLGGSLGAGTLSSLLGSPVSLLGEVALNAQANVLNGPSYDATFSWQTPRDSLDATLIGSGGGVTLQAVSNSLELRYDGANLRVEAVSFDPAAFVEVPALRGQLDGTLTRSPETWDGAVTLTTLEPLESEVVLRGEGDTLELSADFEQGPVTARAEGKLWPELGIDVKAEAAQLATLEGVVSGPLAGARFNTTLQTEPLMLESAELEVPAQTLVLQGDLEDGLSVRVGNAADEAQTDDLTLEGSALSGGLELPFSLQGEPHLLDVALSGGVTDPTVTGNLSGPFVSGPVSFEGERLESRLDLDLAPWTDGLPVTDAEAQLSLSSDTRLDWQASLSAAAEVRGLPTQLNAQLEGQGSAYQGDAALDLAGNPVPVTLSGEGGDARVSARLNDLDLAALNPALPVPLAGLANGTLAYDTSAATPLSYDVTATGELQNRSFSLSAAAGDAPLRARLSVEGANLVAEQTGADAYRFSVDAPAATLASAPVAVTGVLELRPDLLLNAQGQVGDQALAVNASYDPATARALWSANYGGAAVQGEALQVDERWTILSDVTLPEETGLPVAGAASLAAGLEDGVLAIESLDITTELGGSATRLSLAGQAWPAPQLGGRLTVTGYDPVAVGLRSQGEGYGLALTQNGLTLSAELSPGFQPVGAQLVGSGPLPVGQTRLESDLGWQAANGFSGEATLDSELSDVGLNLSLTGEQALRITGTARYRDEQVADVDVSLGPDVLADPALSGAVNVRGNLEQFASAYTGDPLVAQGNLALGGTVSNPSLSGPVNLSGSLEANGDLAWAQGDGELKLRGEGLDAVAALDAAGWRAQLTADALDISAFVPQLAAPLLSAEATLRQGWGEPLSAVANPLRLQTANSLVAGNLAFSEGLRGRLETTLDLRDVQLGPDLRGTLAGSLSVASPDASGSPRLGGSLALEGVELDQAGPWQGAVLDGDVGVSGSLASPFVTAQLSGSGSAGGSLFASFKPAEARYELRSDLHVAGLETDLRLFADGDALTTLEAEGGARYGDYAVTFIPPGEDATSELRLEGRDRLASWSARADLEAQTALLQGSLSSLNSGLAGDLSLSLDGGAGPLLTGSLQNAALGPVELGDVALTSSESGDGRVIALEGERLAASLNLAGLTWTLDRLEPALPADVQVSLSGIGQGVRADLQGNLTGELLGDPAQVPLDLSYKEGVLNVTGAGSLLGGELGLELSGSPDTGWQGRVKLQDADVSGFEAEVSGDISGPFDAPSLVGAYHLARAGNPEQATLQGELLATRDGVNLTGALEAALLQTPLDVQAALWPERSVVLSTPTQTLRLVLDEGEVTAQGRLELIIGPAALELGEPVGEFGDAWLTVGLRDLAPGLGLETVLSARTPAELASLLDEGLTFTGTGTTGGTVTLVQEEGLRLRVDALRWDAPLGTAALSGGLRGEPEGFYGSLRGTWRGDTPELVEEDAAGSGEPAAETPDDASADPNVTLDSGLSPDSVTPTSASSFPWLSSIRTVEFQADLDPSSLSAKLLGDGASATLLADLTRNRADFTAVWGLPTGAAALELSFTPEAGLAGSLSAENFPVFRSEASGAARLDAALALDAGDVAGTAEVRLDGGTVALQGDLGLAGLVPAALAPDAGDARQLSARLNGFNVSAVPVVARYAPYLIAPLSGELVLEPAGISGNLSSDLIIGETVLPLRASVTGQVLDAPTLKVSGQLERSSFDLDWTPDALAGLVRFENFPLESGFAANAGPTDVEARLTGALRFDLPRGDLAESYLRFASEQLRIVRDGVVTEGELGFEIDNQDLIIQEARFEGEGTWQASGEASRERLNLRINARDADFGPLLALIPPLAGLDAGAAGSLQLVSSGSLVNPIVRATSPGIELSLAGSAYELEDLSLTVQNNDFVTSGRLEGVAPLTGSLGFNGGGQLLLSPERSFNLALRFQGNPSLPVLGTLDALEGVITARPGEPWRLDSGGVLGQAFTLEGDLTPLDVRLVGSGLDLKAPQFLLVQSATDTDLRFVWDNGLYVSGGLLARRALLNLEGRERRPDASGTGDAPRRRSPAFARVFFDDVSVRAPQQIQFDENFGTGELGNVDLTLGGTAAQPFLNGSAEALRGTVRFSGRDFVLGQSVAVFQPSQGIFPTLDINAQTSFNKTQVLSGLDNRISFVEPGGSDFQLRLQLAGSIEPSPDPGKPFVVNISPDLTSDAVILTEAGETRSLSEAELFSLLSLGRLQLSPQFASGSGVATSLAEGALDTAVDFLILSELQRELGSALGLDLIEIRTTSLSSLINGDEQDFGVSLRIGGYLSDEVFASYSIGSIGLADGVALSNELNLRYTLDPLEYSLVGTLDFRDDGTAVPAINLGVGYALSPAVQLETGGEVSAVNQSVRFGVSFRW